MRFRLQRHLWILMSISCGGGVPATAFDVDFSEQEYRLDVTAAGCATDAIADDGLDDAPAFVCAISKLAAKGGILHVPAGRFQINSTLVVPRHVTLEGTGFGSELAQKHTLLGPVVRLQAESAMRDLMLSQEQPLPGPGWAPFADYDFQVKIEGDQVTLTDVKLLNPYLGVSIAPPTVDGAVGQTQIFNLRGQPLKEGIRIDHALDVVHVLEVHFWPFWSTDPNVLKWTAHNGVGVASYRNDNPMFEKVFLFAYSIGFLFDRSTQGATSGVTSKPKIVQMDCDACQTAIHIKSSGTRGVALSQVSTQGPKNDFGIPFGGVALFVEANDVSVLASQLDFTQVGANAVRVQGSNVVVRIDNSMVREWNVSGAGFPAFELVEGNSSSSLEVRGTVTGEGHGAAVATHGVVVEGGSTGPL